MAIRVKTLRRPEAESSYMRATLKGMALTFKHLFEKKWTMEYPEQTAAPDWKLDRRVRSFDPDKYIASVLECLAGSPVRDREKAASGAIAPLTAISTVKQREGPCYLP